MIIGLTGPIGSGKGMIANYLKEKNFDYFSLSDIITEELKKKNLEITRKNLQEMGNLLRKQYGSGVLILKLKEKINPEKHTIIDGIRNPGEIEEFKKYPNAYLIGVDAPANLRVQRIKGRAKRDPTKIHEINTRLKKDMGLGESEHGQQVGKCLKLVDWTVINDSTKENAFESLERYLKILN